MSKTPRKNYATSMSKQQSVLIKGITWKQLEEKELENELEKCNISEEDTGDGKYRWKHKSIEKIIEESKTKSKTNHLLRHVEEIEEGKWL